MRKFASRDGTVLACDESGQGPPLLLVHGTGGARQRWQPILPALNRHFSVLTLDRRGRGGSGDGPAYAIEREFDDVAAIIDGLDEAAYLLGHSYGALCSLEAALLTRNLKKLVLYEPPLPLPGFDIQPAGVADEFARLLDGDDREGILVTFMTRVVRMPPEELVLFKASPAWPARVAAAHTLPRELQAHQRYRFEPERFASLRVPTLLLLGGASPPFFAASVAAIHDAVRDSRVQILPDQQHIAIDTAPEAFAGAVLDFLLATG
jgi:pimeloyl-ACP methyl ester carboxylesterase